MFALTLGTTGISVGFNFLGRDFYNALAGMFWCSVVMTFSGYSLTHFGVLLFCKIRIKKNLPSNFSTTWVHLLEEFR